MDLKTIELTADITAAYVSKNRVAPADLGGLIGEIYAALIGTNQSTSPPAAAPALQPAVPIRKSVQPDFVTCLEDGRQFKSLKRHLAAAYGLTPAAYRAKWNLPADYPMVAPNYAATRSALAKANGLGAARRAAISASKTTIQAPPVPKAPAAGAAKRRRSPASGKPKASGLG